MSETNFNWDDLRLFLAVAHHGGLAAASHSTGKSAPTLGRRMLALERHLGRDLFKRLARGYELTDDGREFLERVSLLENHIQPIADIDVADARPIIKLSAGIWVTHLLCQNVAQLIGRDQIKLRFIAADEISDIGRREALIGIRNHRPEGVGLAGRKIGSVSFAVYAKNNEAKTWVRVIGNTPSAKWVQQNVQTDDIIEVTSPRNALDLALHGNVRIVLPDFIGDKSKALKRVSPLIEDLQHEQWLVTHHEDRFMPPVRKVIDRIYQTLKTRIK